jgi:hypothetical protein
MFWAIVINLIKAPKTMTISINLPLITRKWLDVLH